MPADSPMSLSDHQQGLARTTSSGSTSIMRRPGPHPTPQTPESSSLQMSDSQASLPTTAATSQASLQTPPVVKAGAGPEDEDGEEDLPVGVFTLLTDCYSPTCSRESLCYSINCPRRLEQMKRLNMKPTGLSRKLSEESIHDVKVWSFPLAAVAELTSRKLERSGFTPSRKKSSIASTTAKSRVRKPSTKSSTRNAISSGTSNTSRRTGSSLSCQMTLSPRRAEKTLCGKSSGTYTMFGT
jgi:hypothetical protein